ncbi:MAG: BMP family ABC transporter substrate-binding protein [Firmicutes bacterium]|nr:BMP family ABC transporter substrate-binding protein [Bacillota bacterium]
MKRNSFGLLMVAVLVLTLALPAVAAKGQRVVMISPYGKGAPFDSLAYEGLENAARDFNLEIKLVEARDRTEYESQLQAMAELGYDVVIALHDYFGEPMKMVAPYYPKTKFVLVDSQITGDTENMLSVAMEPQEGCYLAGIAAANATQTKKIGFIGGLDHPIIIQFLAGFEAGLRSVDPDITIYTAFSGVFDDPVKGREMGLAMIDRGVDVVMHAADYTGVGVLKAAAERDIWGVGVDLDQSDVAPGHVLISALKDASGAVYETMRMVVQGEYRPGLMIYGIKEGASLIAIPKDLPFYAENPHVLEQIEAARERIEAGEIEVPKTTKTR